MPKDGAEKLSVVSVEVNIYLKKNSEVAAVLAIVVIKGVEVSGVEIPVHLKKSVED